MPQTTSKSQEIHIPGPASMDPQGSAKEISTRNPRKRYTRASKAKPYDRIQAQEQNLPSANLPVLVTTTTAEVGRRRSRVPHAVRFRHISLGCYVPGCSYTCTTVKNPVNSLNSHLDHRIKKGDEPHKKAMKIWNTEKKKVEGREVVIAALESLGEDYDSIVIEKKVVLWLESLENWEDYFSEAEILVIRKRKTGEMIGDTGGEVAPTAAGLGDIKVEDIYDDTQDAEGDVDDEYISGIMTPDSPSQWTVIQHGGKWVLSKQLVCYCIYGEFPRRKHDAKLLFSSYSR